MKRITTKNPFPKGGPKKLVIRIMKEMGSSAKTLPVELGSPELTMEQIIRYAERVAESNRRTGKGPTTALGVLRAQWPDQIKWLREMRKYKESIGKQTISREKALEFAKKNDFVKPGMSPEERKIGLRRALNYLYFLGFEIKNQK